MQFSPPAPRPAKSAIFVCVYRTAQSAIFIIKVTSSFTQKIRSPVDRCKYVVNDALAFVGKVLGSASVSGKSVRQNLLALHPVLVKIGIYHSLSALGTVLE